MVNIRNFEEKSKNFVFNQNKTRMTTFIKTKFNISDDQTNIDNIE